MWFLEDPVSGDNLKAFVVHFNIRITALLICIDLLYPEKPCGVHTYSKYMHLAFSLYGQSVGLLCFYFLLCDKRVYAEACSFIIGRIEEV
jgi:hypothetical protein